MTKTRLETWKDDWRTPIILLGSNDEVNEFFSEQRKKIIHGENKDDIGFVRSIIKFAKELVFDFKDGEPIFTIIAYGLDTESLELVICPLLETVGMDDNGVKENLLLALIYDVPVVPNSEDVAPLLMKYHRELLINGVELGVDGTTKQYLPTKFSGLNIDSLEIVDRFGGGEVFAQAEMLILKDVLQGELEARGEAEMILANLRAAIGDLEAPLKAKSANEAKLQECLTRYPILFGVEYQRVIPKHKLGAEFEMDYALEKTIGVYDLVEIEASTHLIFTKKGDPRKELVHAERQVLDWLQWIDRNAAYARDNLPGIQRPVGYVIIGRRNLLSSEGLDRLRWRNVFYRGDLVILTYDDVLDRAKNLLNLLLGKKKKANK